MLKVEKNIPLYSHVNYRKVQKVFKLSAFFSFWQKIILKSLDILKKLSEKKVTHWKIGMWIQ